MRRLSTAQERELWHAFLNKMSWRFTRDGTRYAWCRDCGRNATTQVEKLMELKYLEPVSHLVPVLVQVNKETTTPYLERYMR
jgi:hypothetical protein